jgi:CheY-like chemotaxis protein
MASVIKNVVMADDDQDDIEMFQLAVNETCDHLSLSVAMDGTKLMTMLAINPVPDAIFLDLNMLGKSGKDCLAEIRSKVKFDDVPVIVLSTSDRKTEIDFCLDNGADHYFTKPHTYEGLRSIVKKLCSGKLTVSERIAL